MNDHWGYNSHDKNFKSTRELLQMLADIASKGGNYLLNVGPTAQGEFPPESVERLREIGQWMEVNGDAIHGTQASPFRAPAWGRCTLRTLDGGLTRLYLHVFEWPKDGRLVVSDLLNEAKNAHLLSDTQKSALGVARDGDALIVKVPAQAPDPVNSVVVLDIVGRPDVATPPAITGVADIFLDSLAVSITSDRDKVELRYTTDGNEPTAASPLAQDPVKLSQTATVSARAFRGAKPVSSTAKATFTKVTPRPAEKAAGAQPGLSYEYFEGDWDRLPEFDHLKPERTATTANFDFPPNVRVDYMAMRYRGFVTVPRDGVYTFATMSDDGSRLYVGDKLVVDNDGLHGSATRSGVVALAAGAHPLTVTYFNKSGSRDVEVWYAGPGVDKQKVPSAALTRVAAAGADAPPVPGNPTSKP